MALVLPCFSLARCGWWRWAACLLVVSLDFILQFPVTYRNFAYFHHDPVQDNVLTLYRQPALGGTDRIPGTSTTESDSSPSGERSSFWFSMKRFFQRVGQKLLSNVGSLNPLLSRKRNDAGKVTVLINQFQRPSCLRKQLRVLRRCAIVRSIYVNWFDQRTPPPSDIAQFLRESEDDDGVGGVAGANSQQRNKVYSGTSSRGGGGDGLEIVETLESEPDYQVFPVKAPAAPAASGGSLTATASRTAVKISEKFRPHLFPTDAVFVTDVDMFYSCHAIQFAYNVWAQYNENEVEPATSGGASAGTNGGLLRTMEATSGRRSSRHREEFAAGTANNSTTWTSAEVRVTPVHRPPHPTISLDVKAVGFHPRFVSRTESYDFTRSYRHSQRYLHNTIFATKGALLHKDLFRDYFKPEYKQLRELVDREVMNRDDQVVAGADLLMSYVIAQEYGSHAFRALCPAERFHMATAASCSANRRPSNVGGGVSTTNSGRLSYPVVYDAEADMLLDYTNNVVNGGGGAKKATLHWRLSMKKKQMIKQIFGTQRRNVVNYSGGGGGRNGSRPPASRKLESSSTGVRSRSASSASLSAAPDGDAEDAHDDLHNALNSDGMRSDHGKDATKPKLNPSRDLLTNSSPDSTAKSALVSAAASAARRIPSHSSVDAAFGRLFQTPNNQYAEGKNEEGFALKAKTSDYQTYSANSMIWERQSRFYMDFWKWLDNKVFGLFNELDCPAAPWRSISPQEFWYLHKVS